MATAITQGDSYLIPVVIRQGETIITDELVDGVKIAIDNAICTYPNGTLTYENGVWYYPLSQKISNNLPVGKADIQVQVKLGNNIIGSKIRKVDIDACIIKGEW